MSAVSRIVDWLRAGYPDGVPEKDYVPLFAVLRRRVGDEELPELGNALVAEGFIPADRIDVAVGITKVTQELPSSEEITRVTQRLASGGWPVELADPHTA